MIKWLWKNKEWVFGGVGIFALSAFFSAIYSLLGTSGVTQNPEPPSQIIQTQEGGDSSTQIQAADGDIYFNSAPDK